MITTTKTSGSRRSLIRMITRIIICTERRDLGAMHVGIHSQESPTKAETVISSARLMKTVLYCFASVFSCSDCYSEYCCTHCDKEMTGQAAIDPKGNKYHPECYQKLNKQNHGPCAGCKKTIEEKPVEALSTIPS